MFFRDFEFQAKFLPIDKNNIIHFDKSNIQIFLSPEYLLLNNN